MRRKSNAVVNPIPAGPPPRRDQQVPAASPHPLLHQVKGHDSVRPLLRLRYATDLMEGTSALSERCC